MLFRRSRIRPPASTGMLCAAISRPIDTAPTVPAGHAIAGAALTNSPPPTNAVHTAVPRGFFTWPA